MFKSVAYKKVFGLNFIYGFLPILCCACVTEGSAGRKDFMEILEQKPQSSLVVEGSARFTARELQPGQWVEYIIRTPKPSEPEQAKSTLLSYKLKILSRGDYPFSFWVEEELTSAEHYRAVREQVVMDDSRLAVANRDPGAFTPAVTDYGKVLEAYSWNGAGEVPSKAEISEGDLVLAQTHFSWLGGAVFEKPQKVGVRAGTFKGCFAGTSPLHMAKKIGIFHFCADPQVPLSGTVQALDPLGRTWELVEFGSVGAQSVFR